ncbi:hypothetical protein ACJ3XI_03520 [Litorimonas sp. RW-G-Af-16]
MTNRYTQLRMKLTGKKRYFVMGFLALEIASLPAAAQVMHKVAFETPPIVSAVEIPTSEAGLKRFLVASNAGFSVEAQSMIGELSVSVHKSGEISGNRFGDKAQLPGEARACAMLTNTAPAAIYVADQKTAQSRGTVVSQAVVFEFRYDTAATPSITFTTDDTKAPPATSCSTSLS